MGLIFDTNRISQIPFDTFYTYFIDAKEFDTVHFCEFEPDEE